MNSYGFLYAVGCVLLLLGERMLGDSQLLRYILSTSGIISLIGSLITSNSILKNASPNQKSHPTIPRENVDEGRKEKSRNEINQKH